MATKSFLSPEAFKEAQKKLKPPGEKVSGVKESGREDSIYLTHSLEFSAWLGEYLLSKMQKAPGWEEAGAIALGSWARGELSPMSDVDVMFCGKEAAVRTVVENLLETGVKLRYRMPEDLKDWSKGVEPFDVLSILNGVALSERVVPLLKEQQQMILDRGPSYKRTLLRAILAERKKRSIRHDSIASYLEPNIKFGPGGLRDLQQALTIIELFPEKFPQIKKVVRVFRGYKGFFLNLRQRLHLQSAGDLMVATEQLELAKWLGYDSIAELMREVQIGLSRVSFYADWVAEQAKSSDHRIEEVNKIKFKNLTQMFKTLHGDDSVLVQERVRWGLPKLIHRRRPLNHYEAGRCLNKYLTLNASEDFLTALFRSRLLEFCIPEIKKIFGLVQHDQYHRYTVDAHLLQMLKELRRVYHAKRLLGPLSQYAKALSPHDWKVLAWAGLYHDMTKGRRGDHSTTGARLVHRDFERLGLSKLTADRVAWLVENHLVLSTAAFRKNPQSITTWRFLHSRGIEGKDLLRLAILTAADIRATNPDAWNDWKADLLAGLVQAMLSSKATRFMSLLRAADVNRLGMSREFIEGLEPFVVEQVPTRILLEDYQRLKSGEKDLPVRIFRRGENYLWIRFHQSKDEEGLFLKYVKLIYDSGCTIVESSVETYPKYGVYDWFKVRSKKGASQLRKIFAAATVDAVEVPEVKFDKIEVVSSDENETLVSFRGIDQKGALLSAAKTLSEFSLKISWARVHTWGRQIDDVFGVETTPEVERFKSEATFLK